MAKESGHPNPGRLRRWWAHGDVLRPRVLWHQLQRAWLVLSGFTLGLSGLVAVSIVVMLLIPELTRRTVSIEPIAVPKELLENGYSPDVASRRLRDALARFVMRANASVKGPEIALRGDVPDIVVPTVGLPLDSLATVIRELLGIKGHQRIAGEFTMADGLLWLRLRLDGRQIYSSEAGGPPAHPDELLAAAVPPVFREVQPIVAAAYWHGYAKDSDRALNIVQKIIDVPGPPDDSVVQAYNLRSWIAMERRNYPEALAAAADAIKIDPRSADTHNTMGGIFWNQHKLDAALAEFRTVARLDPLMAAASIISIWATRYVG
ncbi:MAG: hypothetical protein ABSA58_25820 [Acetobacteraceae bacterium]